MRSVKTLFVNNKLLNWEKPDNIEFYRQPIQQSIIDNFFDLTFSFININEIINSKKIIIDIGSGYGKWLNKFIKKYKNKINNFSIYSYDINDILGNYLKEFINIENRIKDEIIEIGLYCIFRKKDLRKQKIDFVDNSVYFVYQRDMITVYNLKEWKFIIKEIYRVLIFNCKCEFVEYNFIIKNVGNNDITNIINKCIEKKFKKINIDIIINMINKYFNNIDYTVKRIPLYNEYEFNGIGVENIILYYTHFMDDILKIFKKEYNNILTYNEIIDLLISEWEDNKSYIEIYFISVKKEDN